MTPSVRLGPRSQGSQGSRRCFADVTNQGQITFATQTIIYISKLKLCFLREKKTAGKPQVAAVVVNWFLLKSLSDIIVIQLHVAKISLQNTGIECVIKLKNAYCTLG